MDRVISAERGEELPGFELQVVGKVCSLKERFLDFDFGLVVVTKFENNVREAFEIGIDRTVEGKLDVTRVEPALLWVVIANFDMVEVARAGVSESKQAVERNVHVILAARNANRRRQR